MYTRKRLASALGVAVLVGGLTVVPASAEFERYGEAKCIPNMVGGISAISQQIDTSKFMFVSVGSKEKSGFGFHTITVDTNLRQARWYVYATGNPYKATGYCRPA